MVVSIVWIVRTTESIVVIATAGEAVPSGTKAAVADVRATCTKATDAAGAKATHATDVASTKATHVTPANDAAHVASAKAAAAMTAATTTATAAAGFGTSGQ
jgi:hypothetical protein